MNIPSLLTGPAEIPANPSHLLVFLHGFGADGNDLIPLAAPLKQALGKVGETLGAISLHAPYPDEIGQGRQWFSNVGWKFNDRKGLQTAAMLLEKTLANLSATHKIPRQNIALIGFSQGAMTALHALPSLTTPPAAVIGCSGGLTVEPALPPKHAISPILLTHGLADDVWPTDYTVKAETFFKAHGYPVHMELLEDLAHGIDARTLAHITLFLGNLWNK